MRLLLLTLAACTHDPEGGDWMPHAAIVSDPALTALPDRQVPPPQPLRAPGDRPDVTVYGYWPYWGDNLDTLMWDQLTHVAIFNVDLNPDGTLSQTQRWHNVAAQAMSLAAPYGVRVHLCMTSFSDATTNAVLSSAAYRATAINQLAALVNQYGAHGVNIDIEGLDYAQKANFVTFVREANARFDDVFVAMPAVDWSGAFDYDQIALNSDGLFIMGYGYHWTGGNPGPNAPLYGGAPWGVHSLSWTVDDYRTWGAPDDTLVLGLPLYGNDWPSTGTNVPGTATGTGSAAVYTSAVATARAHGRRYDTGTETPYTFPSSTRQLWYDDAESLAAKIQYAVDEGIQGVGFWALTYDDADPVLWQAIDAITHTGPTGPAVVALTPGTAGVINTIRVEGAAANAQLTVVAGYRPGSTAVPGCAGLSLPYTRPIVLGSLSANAAGQASFNLLIPRAAAGLTLQLHAVDTSRCQMGAGFSEAL
jgi:spore germination protein